MPHIDTHTQNVARTQTHKRTLARTYVGTHEHTHTHTYTHTHTTTLFPVALCFPIYATREMFKVPSTYRPRIFSILPETLSCTSRIPTKNGLNMCSTGKKNSQILFSLASFLLMSSYSCKRMSRDQIQKQPTVRASLLVGTRRCHKLYRAHTLTCTKHLTHARALVAFLSSQKPFTHTHTHTH